ncbi:MAG: hypothetical protein R2941_09755 [Desulfobacterales bacterium]
MQEVSLTKIQKETENLSLHELLKLLEMIVCQIRKKSGSDKQFDWKEIYGLGANLWKGEDAQEYVNRMREDRL